MVGIGVRAQRSLSLGNATLATLPRVGLIALGASTGAGPSPRADCAPAMWPSPSAATSEHNFTNWSLVLSPVSATAAQIPGAPRSPPAGLPWLAVSESLPGPAKLLLRPRGQSLKCRSASTGVQAQSFRRNRGGLTRGRPCLFSVYAICFSSTVILRLSIVISFRAALAFDCQLATDALSVLTIRFDC